MTKMSTFSLFIDFKYFFLALCNQANILHIHTDREIAISINKECSISAIEHVDYVYNILTVDLYSICNK